MSLVPFQAADDIGDRFLSLLQRNGIQPPIGSSLEDELLSLTQLVAVMIRRSPRGKVKLTFCAARQVFTIL